MSKQNALIIKEQTSGFTENTKYFVNTIYTNFVQLSKYPKLKHTRAEINKLLKSPKMYALLVYDINHKIMAYLIGEIVELSTGKIIFYITYLYVVSQFRNLGIASKLINLIITKVELWKLDGVMLICNTGDQKLYDFYLKRGFMPDQTYRRNEQYEVLSMYI
jgi:GNAT superfamily N-acetyltransferase